MRLLCLTLYLAVALEAPVAPLAPRAPLAPLTAAEIARRVQDRDTGRDSRAELRMKLFDRRGRAA